MQKLFFLFPLLVLLSACGPDPVQPNEGRYGTQPSVSIESAWRGSADHLYVNVNGTSETHIDNIRDYHPTNRHEYAQMGVPSHAVAAGMFWGLLDHDEDGQGIYAAIEGRNVNVYTAYYVPGEYERTQWQRIDSIAF